MNFWLTKMLSQKKIDYNKLLTIKDLNIYHLLANWKNKLTLQIKCPVLHKVCEFDKENGFTKLTENDKKVTDRDKTLVFRYDEKFLIN